MDAFEYGYQAHSQSFSQKSCDWGLAPIEAPRAVMGTLKYLLLFVADGINSVGDYNSSPGGCPLCVCVCVSVPTFFHVSRWDNF